MKAGVVQIDATFGAVTQNIEKVLGLISSEQADLWVLPELFNTGYQFTSKKEVKALSEPIPEGPTTQALIQAAKTFNTTIVAGLAEREGGQCFNSAVLVGPKGYRATYRKIHLFYEENRWFTPGDRPFEVHTVLYQNEQGRSLKCRIGIMICFDWIFPESARTLALLGTDVLCHPSNLVLPHCPQAMITRCLENRIFALTANRVGSESRGKETLRFIGQSQVVTPSGKILHRAPDNGESAHVALIDPKEARDKSINRYNHLFKNRAEQFYR
ncbi:MAG: nitrilase-related carbon-nitrogen hydrolase [Nitrospiria bacterium]